MGGSTVIYGTFIRRLFDATAGVRRPGHHIKLNASMRSDLSWWQEFLTELISLIKKPKKAVQHTAHINIDSYSLALGAHNALRCLRIAGVIGSLSLLVQVSANPL